ncbi:MAG TPA: O-antigen ligase family protein [Aggregicoccus sp.]|nr:O-antigen ligase family protein [Aggregicoccus sp.]
MRVRLPNPGLREFGLAAFLTAGYFKADPRLAWLPVDLTLLFAVWTVAALAWQWLREGYLPLTRSTLLLLVFFAVLAPGLLASGGAEYAAEKSKRLFSLTLLAAVAPALLLRGPEQLRRFLRSLAVLGALMGVDAAVILVTSPQMNRLQVFNSDTIALGRATGTTFLWICILWLERQLGTLKGLLALVGLAGLMLASGTRAALLGGALTLLASFWLFYRREGGAAGRLALYVGAGAMALVLAVPLLPKGSLLRVQESLSGELDHSGQCRVQAYAESLPLIAASPLGIGLGDFAERIPIKCGRSWMRYPHNILIELALESGLAAALALVALSVLGVRKLYRLASATGVMEGRALFALLLFFCVNVMFSGDVNDNKLFLALLGLSLSADRLLTPHPIGDRHVPSTPEALPCPEAGPARAALPGHGPLRA